jgi:hypothetical protein
MDKDIDEICSDIIENYQDSNFKVDQTKLKFTQDEKEIMKLFQSILTDHQI